jgi:hypothetical protein
MEEAVAHWNRVGTPSMTLRTPQQIARFFDGLELLPPGVVSCSRWRPRPPQTARRPPRWTSSAASRAKLIRHPQAVPARWRVSPQAC